MPKPQLDKAEFKKLTKVGSSPGTVTEKSPGGNIAKGHAVSIKSKDSEKTWEGSVVSPTANSLIWNASVDNVHWDHDPKRITETVTVTVSNASGTSNPVNTGSDVS